MAHRIRRALRKKESGQYLKADGTFTDDFDEALLLDELTSALEVCRHFGVTGMELVLRFNGSQYDVRLPISDGYASDALKTTGQDEAKGVREARGESGSGG